MEPQDFAAPETEPAVAPEQLSSDVPSADNSDPIAADPALLEHIEAELDRHRDEVVHTIEHRSFGRASADEPMPSTVITGA